MLKSIVFENYFSFKNRTVIDLTPSKISYLSNSNIYNGVLKGCAFYGANASGKSNALSVINLLIESLLTEAGLKRDFYSKFSDKNKAYFEYNFKFDNDEIKYLFEVDKKLGITLEELSVNNKMYLNRTLTSDKAYLTSKEDFSDLDKYTLLLRTIYKEYETNNNLAVIRLFNYLSNSAFINALTLVLGIKTFNKNHMGSHIAEFINKNGVKSLNDFLKKYNFPYEIMIKDKENANYIICPLISRIYLKRKGLKEIRFMDESRGTMTFLDMLPLFIDTVNNEGILIIDEFSGGLHPDLEELLIKYFYENSKEAQIFFVTQSTNILKTSLIRPDQVYATELNTNGSEVTKFSDYPIRENQNMEKMYLAGAFGGLPNYKKWALQNLNKYFVWLKPC